MRDIVSEPETTPRPPPGTHSFIHSFIRYYSHSARKKRNTKTTRILYGPRGPIIPKARSSLDQIPKQIGKQADSPASEQLNESPLERGVRDGESACTREREGAAHSCPGAWEPRIVWFCGELWRSSSASIDKSTVDHPYPSRTDYWVFSASGPAVESILFVGRTIKPTCCTTQTCSSLLCPAYKYFYVRYTLCYYTIGTNRAQFHDIWTARASPTDAQGVPKLKEGYFVVVSDSHFRVVLPSIVIGNGLPLRIPE